MDSPLQGFGPIDSKYDVRILVHAILNFELGVVTFAASQAVRSDQFNSVPATASPAAAFVVAHDIAVDLVYCWRKKSI